jgi:hypothetical protein
MSCQPLEASGQNLLSSEVSANAPQPDNNNRFGKAWKVIRICSSFSFISVTTLAAKVNEMGGHFVIF